MKPLFFRVPSVDQRSFRIQKENGPSFYGQLHFHPEIQLTLIEKGEGTLVVGNRIDRFQPYDLLLLGSNLPHVLRSTPGAGNEQAVSTSVLFMSEPFEQQLLAFPEMVHLKQLLSEARHGVRLQVSADDSLVQEFEQLPEQRPFQQFLFLVRVLDQLAGNQQREILSRMAYERPSRPDDHQRLERIFSYILQHYAAPIGLEEVAGVANLTPGAFCRFFRQHTRKTFSHLLNEVRIEHACRLLRESRESISEIAFQCGYTNLSNFNRRFKEITGMPPRDYVRTYRM
ncbi:AraC family transcriptional regulator [Siphonobacter sp. BAB-5405]|uniref:AraC family transcriptional regulator n=1 Tax=Siphonobacter sp. BAB-5405 TaxID=1864825 RepID=UPI000C80D861|nr:AraC family transcriptional regulator [Siphonobacter sp. BAB-5405]PMD91418.1 AraC family transcriptional regulator [Siphonobacter sp. BAB-5405]